VILDAGDSVDLNLFNNVIRAGVLGDVASRSALFGKLINTIDGIEDSADLLLSGLPLVITEKVLLIDADLVGLLGVSGVEELLLLEDWVEVGFLLRPVSISLALPCAEILSKGNELSVGRC